MSLTVLIVDDSKLARMSVVKSLKSLQPDWSHVEAANADEALAIMKQKTIGLALLDFNMPGRDGIELAGELKALNPSVHLAVVSANHQDEIVKKANALGAAFLAKPLTEAVLAQFLAGVGEVKPAAS